MPPRRRRGFGFVRRLPSGKWQASYVGPDLARHNAPSTFLTKGDAEGWLGVQRQLITSGHWGSTSSGALESAAISVLSAYSTQWLADRELKPRTREGYEHLLRRYIAPELGACPLDQVTPVRVREWWNRLPKEHPTVRARAYALTQGNPRDGRRRSAHYSQSMHPPWRISGPPSAGHSTSNA